jgi:hypothetical protein
MRKGIKARKCTKCLMWFSMAKDVVSATDTLVRTLRRVYDFLLKLRNRIKTQLWIKKSILYESNRWSIYSTCRTKSDLRLSFVAQWSPPLTTFHPILCNVRHTKIFTIYILLVTAEFEIGWSRNRIFFYFAKYEITTNVILISRNSAKFRCTLFREISRNVAKFRINYFAKLFRYVHYSNANTFREISQNFV